MIDFNYIRNQLKDSSMCKVSKAAGITYPTLQRLMQGGTNFNLATIEKLMVYIEKRNAGDADEEIG